MSLEVIEIVNVDVDNVFVFANQMFTIGKHKDYKVFNSYHDSENYTNTCDMTTVKVAYDNESKHIVFLDEKDKEIKDLKKGVV